MQDWAYQWRMSFNLDRAKKTQEVYLRKTYKIFQQPLYFNNATVRIMRTQKHLGLQLDKKLLFNGHVNNKISKATKGIEHLRKLQPLLPYMSLLIIYKLFVRPHLDYGDIVYEQPFNASFSNKIKSLQYNSALAITGTIKGSLRDKLYQELGLKYLHQRRWMTELFLHYKFLSTEQPSHIRNLHPQMRNSTDTSIPLVYSM